MNRTHRRTVLVGLALLILPALLTWSWADDVKIHVIDPDARPVQPAPKVEPTPGQPTAPEVKPAANPQSKDWVLTVSLQRVKLTEDQKIKLAEVLNAEGVDPAVNELMTKLRELQSKAGAAYKDAEKAGAKVPFTQPEVQAMYREMEKANLEVAKAQAEARERLMPKIAAVLTEEQNKQLQEAIEANDNTPQGNARRQAKYLLQRLTPGVELTEEQARKALDAVLPIVDKQGTLGMEQMMEMAGKLKPQFESLMKNPNDAEAFKGLMDIAMQGEAKRHELGDTAAVAVDAVLTPEQRQKAAHGRRQRDDESFKAELKSLADHSPREFGLDEPQQKKVAELSNAAIEAAGKTEMDNAARGETMKQLFADIWNLMTDEQKKKFLGNALKAMDQMH